jgi:hypothetical protein
MTATLPIRVIDNSRARRIAELLIVLCLLSMADLVFTIWAQLFTPFYELNPLARGMLSSHAFFNLVVMKVTLTGFGAAIFWRLRSFWRVELALWVVVALYVCLAIRWNNYTVEAMVAMVN